MTSGKKVRTFIKNHSCFGAGGDNYDVENVSRESDAADKLQASILKAVNKISFPGGLGCSNSEIVNGIRQNLDASAFDRHNQDYGIVEARATFHAIKADGSTVFDLVIIWGMFILIIDGFSLHPPDSGKRVDADVPPTDSDQKPHFGWEIYLNDSRVAGPNHVFFKTGKTLKHYRRPGLDQTEEHSLKMSKTGTMGSGKMASETHYFKLARP